MPPKKSIEFEELITDRETVISELMKRRKKAFDIKINAVDDRWKAAENEIEVSVTFNGFQWNSLTLTPREALITVAKITQYLASLEK